MHPVLSFADRVVRKVRRPWRRRAYAARTTPFVHRGAKGLRFRLEAGEYIDGEIFVEGIYELYHLRWIERNLAGGTFVDVGANIGNHALYLAGAFDEVHCFEPNPPIADRLAHNAALNGIDLAIHRVGLGAEDGELPFHSDLAGNAGGSRFVSDPSAATNVLPIRNGDRWFRENGIARADLIKIDVEGFELEVLKGLRETIGSQRPKLVLEFDGTCNAPEELIALLPGYRLDELTGTGTPMPFRGERRYHGAIVARPE